MFKGEHAVRWIAASTAAIGLHALLWIAIPSTKIPHLHQQTIEIAWVTGQIKAPVMVKPQHQTTQAMTKQATKPLTHQRIPIQQKRKAVQVKTKHLLQQKIKEFHVKHNKNNTVPAHIAHQSAQHATKAKQQTFHAESPIIATKTPTHPTIQGTRSVPKALQTHILMKVHYPKQAKRHGWQGKVELQLQVKAKSIQTITLVASSGYPILDRAAYRGVAQINHIPLSNGLYHMPIVFRLQ